MGCDVAFYISGFKNPIRVDNTRLSASDNSIEKFAKILLENDQQLTELTANIEEAQKQEKHFITTSDLKKGLVGNTNLHNLMNEYTGVTWPEDLDDFQFNILLVNNFKYNGKRTYGRVIDMHGNELFIIQNSEQDVQKFANYLKVRKSINNFEDDNEELEEILEIVKEELGNEAPTTVKELLVDFQDNENKYRGILKNGVDVYHVLYTTLRSILNLDKKPVFTTPLVTSAYSRLSFNGNYARLSRADFWSLFTTDYPEVINNLKKQGYKASEITKDEDILKELVQTYIIDKEPTFDYYLSSINSDNIVFRRAFGTIQDLYGFTYDTLKLVNLIETYRGYNIYYYIDPQSKEKSYFYNRNMLTLNSQSRKINSIEEVRRLIDKKADNDIIQETANLIFKFNKKGANTLTSKVLSYQEDNLIPSINITLDSQANIPDDEMALLKSNIQKFYEYYKNQLPSDIYENLQSIIDDTEKAAIFIYRLGEELSFDRDFSSSKTQDSQKVLEILKQIDDNKENKKYYYIEKAVIANKEKINRSTEQVKVLKVIPTSDTVEFNTKYNRPQPIITMLNDIVELFRRKFDVKVHILNAQQIMDMPQISENTKAFIKDGEIYINGSLATAEDAIHEYTHLFLGVLKSRNFPMYQQLLQKVANDKKSSYTRKEIKRLYGNISETDLQEEIFAKRFSEHLAGKNKDVIFKEAEQQTNNQIKTIFNLASEEDFNTLYKGNIYNIFNRFSSDIRKEVNMHNDLDFSVGTVYRKASNWINEQIKSGQIIEKC